MDARGHTVTGTSMLGFSASIHPVNGQRCIRLDGSVFVFDCLYNNVGFASVTGLAGRGVVRKGQLRCVHRGANGLVGLKLSRRTLRVVKQCTTRDGNCLFPVLGTRLRGAPLRGRGEVRGVLKGIGGGLGRLTTRLKIRSGIAACATQRSFTDILGGSNMGVTLVDRTLKRSSLTAARVCLSDFSGRRMSRTVGGLLWAAGSSLMTVRIKVVRLLALESVLVVWLVHAIFE